MFRTANPAMKEEVYTDRAGAMEAPMTLNGTISKTGILMAILVATAAYGWLQGSMGLVIAGGIVGFILAIVTIFKPQWSPYTAPMYAAAEGLLVGGVSLVYSQAMTDGKWSHIVPLAVLSTFLVLAVMLALYVSRVIRVTDTFKMVVIGATVGIMFTYVATLLLGFFFPGVWNMPIYQAGPIGILFSVGVIIIAALNLALDFNIIETGIEVKAPRYMEWYAGFALLVTLVWLYLEILRLMSKLSRR